MFRVISDTPVPIKIWASDMEMEAEKQVRNMATLPFIHSHVAVMADAHAGKGSTVGTVIATKGAIIPAAVGVDIGCGMCAVKLPFKINQFKDLPNLRHSIERSVPVGRHGNKDISSRVKDFFDKAGTPRAAQFDHQDKLGKAREQCGSLGGGNHFIELCQDQNDDAWIVLHSGSRNIGKELADIHIHEAQGLMKKYFINLPDPDLAYLSQQTPEFDNYIHDLHWAQNYAKMNREEMMTKIIEQINRHLNPNWLADYMPSKYSDLRVDCHHNYTQMENHYGANIWVTRKGAVSAREGELGIIPGSMGAKSFIVRGRGNVESFMSCSHGAGRKMSRTKARASYTEADLIAQTRGVECRKDKDVIDEIPAAYKDIDQVMADQVDLVEPVFTLKQVLCVKG